MSPDYRPLLAGYEQAEPGRSLRQFVETAVLYGLVWFLAYRSLDISVLATLALAFPAAGLAVRLFIIQHDCGHGSFFSSRQANDWIGRMLGVVTLTPYGYWRRFHASHHATSGRLDDRAGFDFLTLTVREYRALSWWKRWAYRLYRHPVFLGIGAPVWFALVQRIPWIAPRAWRAERRSILGTDLAIAAVAATLVLAIGPRALVMVQLPITALAAATGMWLFYVQHQFERAYWADDASWDFTEASLAGSSHLELPPLLRWFTGDIGIHHLHHLNSGIPNYRLRACLRENPELRAPTRLTLADGVRCLRLKLWDEERRQLVGFPS